MDDWAYVVLAYTAVGGTIAAYAVLLLRRIARASAGVEMVRRTVEAPPSTVRQEEPACDALSVPS